MRIIPFVEPVRITGKVVVALVFTLCVAGAGAAQKHECHPITFPRGETSAVVKGEVSAARSVCYKLRLRDGQHLSVHLTSPERRARFSISPDYFDADFLPRGYNVTDWEGEPESAAGNDYMIIVTLSAKRVTDTYTLEVNIPAAGSQNTRRAAAPPCGNFSGTYATHYGLLRLMRTGDQVHGVYSSNHDQDSTVTGTVRGNVLSGRWTEPGRKGTFTFTLDPDGHSFTGGFFFDGDRNQAGEWGGHCADDDH